jgi:hypothetical protein
MLLNSDALRRQLAHIEREIRRLEGRAEACAPDEPLSLVDLRIHRNLLQGVLEGREVENERKIVSLARWRLGFAPAVILRRFGYLPDGASKGLPRAPLSVAATCKKDSAR